LLARRSQHKVSDEHIEISLRETEVAKRFHECRSALLLIRVVGDEQRFGRYVWACHVQGLSEDNRPIVGVVTRPSEEVAIYRRRDDGALRSAFPNRMPGMHRHLEAIGYDLVGGFSAPSASGRFEEDIGGIRVRGRVSELREMFQKKWDDHLRELHWSRAPR
jgi:hypothetical protein